MIPYGRQSISEADIAAVVEVLRSDYLTQGPMVPRFERAVADYCHAKHGIAVASGTAALHIACLALGVGQGDWVWTTAISFVASANCARYCGAKVDFVDVEVDTANMSVAALRTKLVAAAKEGRLPKVVIPVHFAGQPCDMAEIAQLAQEYGFKVIEDACHALGARYRGEAIGNSRYSDITILSFHPVKNITTGEGGMALTNQAELAQKMALFRSHGITRDVAQLQQPNNEPWYYEQLELGYHYRMTDLQAALGLSQMQRADQFLAQRTELDRRYRQELDQLGIGYLAARHDRTSALHLFVAQVDPEQRLAWFKALRSAGIGVNVHYIPIYWQPDFAQFGYPRGYCPNAEAYYAGAISLPLFPHLGHDQAQVIAALAKLKGAETESKA